VVAKLEASILDAQSGHRLAPVWVARDDRSLLPALSNDEADLLPNTGVTTALKEEVLFSRPYYTSELVLIINPNNVDLRPNQLVGARIGVRAGAPVEGFMKAQHPKTALVGFSTLDDAVLALKRGETAGVVDDQYRSAYSLDTLPGVGALEILPGTLGSVECAVAVRKNDEELMKLIDEVIADMQRSGDYARILEENDGGRLANVLKRHPKRLDDRAKAERPRNVTIRVSKDPNSEIDIYKLANLPFTLTNQGRGESFASSRVEFQQRIGVCRATIPPGSYVAAIPKMNFRASFGVSETDPPNVTINMRIQADGSIVVRRE
jgi:ABC-type amino acid transport substrate-binding protein